MLIKINIIQITLIYFDIWQTKNNKKQKYFDKQETKKQITKLHSISVQDIGNSSNQVVS